MATYAIGDVQGCFETLQRLLHRIRFRPGHDRLWLVGDLVNRGPRSLDVLRWAVRQSDLTVVLGNHDLHLLARAAGVRRAKPTDTLEPILQAPDREQLLDWLREQRLAYREGGFLLVHAGVLPAWSADQAIREAQDVESALRADPSEILRAFYRSRDLPRWGLTLETSERLRVSIHVLTQMRTCTEDGRPCVGYSGPPEQAPGGCRAWFDWPVRATREETVVFGHWAALGLRVESGVVALDTGCVWGGSLTAVRLDDRAVFREPLADI